MKYNYITDEYEFDEDDDTELDLLEEFNRLISESCEHEWEEYIGFTHKFNFCRICGIKE